MEDHVVVFRIMYAPTGIPGSAASRNKGMAVTIPIFGTSFALGPLTP